MPRDVRVIDLEADLQVIGGLPTQANAARLLLVIVVAIRQVSITTHDVERGPHREVFLQRHVHCALHAPQIVVAEVDGQIAAELRTRLLRDDVDDARGGVPAIERSLRSLEHLDARHVIEVAADLAGAGDVDSVDVHRDRGLGSTRLRCCRRCRAGKRASR